MAWRPSPPLCCCRNGGCAAAGAVLGREAPPARRPLGRPWCSRAWHGDRAETPLPKLAAQASGRCRVTLFDPSQAFEGLYPYPVHHGYDSYAMVDLEKPELDRWPKAAGLRGIKALLHPGDCLFVPAYWCAGGVLTGEHPGMPSTGAWPGNGGRRRLAGHSRRDPAAAPGRHIWGGDARRAQLCCSAPFLPSACSHSDKKIKSHTFSAPRMAQMELLSSENTMFTASLAQGQRALSPGAAALHLARALEQRVAETEPVQAVRWWLQRIAGDRPVDYRQLGTVKGYKRVVMEQGIRDDVEAVLGSGACAGFLRAVCDGRLEPTPWLNQVLRRGAACGRHGLGSRDCCCAWDQTRRKIPQCTLFGVESAGHCGTRPERAPRFCRRVLQRSSGAPVPFSPTKLRHRNHALLPSPANTTTLPPRHACPLAMLRRTSRRGCTSPTRQSGSTTTAPRRRGSTRNCSAKSCAVRGGVAFVLSRGLSLERGGAGARECRMPCAVALPGAPPGEGSPLTLSPSLSTHAPAAAGWSVPDSTCTIPIPGYNVPMTHGRGGV